MTKKKMNINPYSLADIAEKQHQNEKEYRILVELYLSKSRSRNPEWNSIEIRKSTRWEWQKLEMLQTQIAKDTANR
jgi:hypothetical protein